MQLFNVQCDYGRCLLSFWQILWKVQFPREQLRTVPKTMNGFIDMEGSTGAFAATTPLPSGHY